MNLKNGLTRIIDGFARSTNYLTLPSPYKGEGAQKNDSGESHH
jgi:hypothetical protein